jgi:23S rRNA (pseudouridine1915-N3)-methyltransferase
MLSLRVITVGRDKDVWITDQVGHFRTLLKKYARVETISVPEAKYVKGADISRILAVEGERVIAQLKGGYLIALDVGGKSYDTARLAAELQRLQTHGHSMLEFVIGGPYGLAPGLKQQAAQLLSLSPLTMSHQIVRVVLLEQLYRVLDINAGGHYHK